MTAAHHDAAPTARVLAALTEAGSQPRRNGAGHIARCPNPNHGKGNGDRNPSLSVSEGRDGKAVLYCHAGCHTEDVLSALNLTPSDLFADDGERRGNVYPLRSWKLPPRPVTVPPVEECTEPACRSARRSGETCTARYTYTDENENPLGVVHRWDPKTFRPFTPDGKGGWKVGGIIPPVPYALPRVLETLRRGGLVLVVEGEKDADAVNAYGLADLCATTNAQGAKKWRAEHVAALAEVASLGQIVICGDNDEPGREHVAVTVRTFTDAGLPAPMTVYPMKGKDLAEHLDLGGNLNLGEPDGLREPVTYPRLGRILSLEDLEALPPIRWGVEDWLSSPSAALLVGPYSVGKSAVTLSMACSVASGTTFLGHDVEQRRVLYVVGEGARGLQGRVRAWRQIWNRELSPDALRFMTKPAGSLREEATWKELRRFCDGEGFGFVVLDTFSSLAPEADETKDAALIVAGLNQLAEQIDGTAVLVHHPGWSQTTQDRARGAYQLEGNNDEVIILSPVAEGSDHISAKIKKRKDGEAGAVHYLRRVGVHLTGPDGKPLYDDRGNPVTAVTVEHANLSDTTVPMRTRILGYLAACGDLGATPREIASQIGLADASNGSFREALRTLTGLGDIRSEGSTHRRRYFHEGDDT